MKPQHFGDGSQRIPKFEVILIRTVNVRPAKGTQRDPGSQQRLA